MSFEIKQLGEVANITKLAGFEFSKYIDYIPNGEIIALRALNVKNNELDLDNIKRISKEVSISLPRSQLNANDIVLTYTGNGYGDAVLINENNKYHLAPNIAKITPKKETHPIFLFNFIKSNFFKRQLSSHIVGSSQPTIPMKTLRILEVPFPEYEVQEKIGKFLGFFDRLITNNLQINNNLEIIGNELFKKWFVHFEFPDENGQQYKSSGGKMVNSELGEIPIGWQLKPLDEIANYLNGLALQKYPPKNDDYLPVIKIRELKQGITQKTDKASIDIPKEYIIDDGDVIFSWSGSLKIAIWGDGKGALNQHLFKVTSEEYPKWFYYYQTLKFLPIFIQIAADRATTMGHIKRSHLSESIVPIPPKNIIKQADEILNPIIEQIINNKINSRYLSSIRDALLPKLMSGEIDVSEVDI